MINFLSVKNNEEAKDIQRMRELLNHKSNIIRQVEEAYEEEEVLLDAIVKKHQELGELKNAIDLGKNRLKVLEKSQGGRYKTYKYLKIQMEETKRRLAAIAYEASQPEETDSDFATDIVFLVDVTQSMQPALEALKRNIGTFVDLLSDKTNPKYPGGRLLLPRIL